ncbi:MAG: YceI family protein [Bacteroidetes bacterium]|nr:YceI family protein [Bacteroidota bacterium]
MNKLVSILAVTILFTLTGSKYSAQNTEWTIESSSVSFKIKNAGFTIDGKFGVLTGTIIFDAVKSYSNSIDVFIDSKSINTGNGTRDGHLKKKEYFDVDAYPKINIKGSCFAKEKDGTFKGYFKLTLKGKSKDVVVPFSFTEKDGKGIFKGAFTINRLDYGVGENSMVLSDNATITIEVNVIKKQ